MTETLHQTFAVASEAVRAPLARRIEAAVTRAFWVLAWEALWPRLVWPVGVLLAFVALSWLGLWLALPDWARLVGLAAFGIAFLASLLAFRGFALPARGMAIARIEATSALPGRPLQTLEDSLPATADEATRALWQAHRMRLQRRIGPLNTGWPDPGVDRADRYGLRLLVALFLFVGFFAAGDARLDRLFSAFRPVATSNTPGARLDAWVTPPEYTAKPALLLTADRPPPTEADGTILVPEGSLLTLRATALAREAAPTVTVRAGIAAPVTLAAKAPAPGQATPATDARHPAPTEFETKLAGVTEVVALRGSSEIGRWRFSVIPDQPPTIRFIGEPEAQGSGTLKLGYEIADDYGVVSAEAHFEAAPGSFPVTSNAGTVRPLVPAPDFPLSLPGGHPKSGQSTAFRDLTSHPWAGGKVRVTLIARDDAGHEARSETKEITLPARFFSKPLARALVEQRRILALDANRKPQVDDAIDALLIGPDKFYPASGLYLAVAQIYRQLTDARSDDDLKAVLDLIWQVATGIEDGNLSEAQKAVRDAEEALRNALDHNTSQEEIAKLTQDLRKALDKLVNELAEQQRRAPGLKRSMTQNQKILREEDLRRMLDRIENLAKTGSRDAARQMLSEMQRMLENLQQGNAGEQGQQQQSEANDLLDQLGDMIQRQQQLMDKTHKLDGDSTLPPFGAPNPPDGAQKQMTPEELQKALRDLQQNQNALRKTLKDLQDKLAQQGLDRKPGARKAPGQGQNPGQTPGAPAPGMGNTPGQDPGAGGEDGPFGPAGDAMDEAGKSLAEGDTGNAVDAQGRAVDALRDGAKKLLDQLAQRQPGQQGPGAPSGEAGNPGDDPLGRPRRNTGPQDTNSVKVPDEIDTQRARQVLEEIRRRLSETMRPGLELDYLERLLQGQ